MPRIEKVPIDAVIQTVCIWKGCDRTIFVSDTYPAGWKCIVVALVVPSSKRKIY